MPSPPPVAVGHGTLGAVGPVPAVAAGRRDGRTEPTGRTLSAGGEVLRAVAGVGPGAIGLLHLCHADGLRFSRDDARYRSVPDTTRHVVRHLLRESDAMPVGRLHVLAVIPVDVLAWISAARSGAGRWMICWSNRIE